jgi:GNAT superfamily N-acetyltransferase
MQSELAVRRERLEQHLGHAASVPQTWLALSHTSVSGSRDAPLIGCVSVVSYHLGAPPNPPDADTPLWLSNLYVEPSWRRCGVAGSLMAQVKSFASDLGMSQLWLTATDQADFYCRRGWATQRRAKLGGRWVSVMSLALGDTP